MCVFSYTRRVPQWVITSFGDARLRSLSLPPWLLGYPYNTHAHARTHTYTHTTRLEFHLHTHTLTSVARARTHTYYTHMLKHWRAVYSLLLGLPVIVPGKRLPCVINHSSGTLCSRTVCVCVCEHVVCTLSMGWGSEERSWWINGSEVPLRGEGATAQWYDSYGGRN